jgi:hypothetical protein
MSTPALPDWMRERMLHIEAIMRQLLGSTAVACDEWLRGLLTERQGI